MTPAIAEGIVLVVGVYALIGILVAPILVFFQAARFDPATEGASRGFRLIILPGAVLLWPVLLRRWLAARRAGGSFEGPPAESNAHRMRAATSVGDGATN